MWKRLGLRSRIYLILTLLVSITFFGGAVMVWYTYRMEGLFDRVINRNIAAFQAAEALETALVNQKGFVTYYFLDKNPDWLRRLGAYRQIFKAELEKARALVEGDHEEKAIGRIESEYMSYITSKDQVIAYYRAGEREKGRRLHKKVRDHFFKTLELCEEYKALHTQKIKKTRTTSQAQAANLRIIAATAMVLVLVLGALLTFILIAGILEPVRRMAMEADREGGAHRSPNEVAALGKRVRGLIQDIDHTHFELMKSREILLQAEKMALVGKLAAGTAHSIRNPLTSVKMRLFSLARSLDLSDTQAEDFQVISEEIRHIDTIVQNFLEFSRPPKLKMEQVRAQEVVDLAVQLLKHRLQSYNVEVRVERINPLPPIQADPEQLKEVFVNLVVNACEAMEGGGEILIREEAQSTGPTEQVVVIRVADNGPGIPQSLVDKVLQPFFTTKEEGTGLGLSIAARIVEQHGGDLAVTTVEGKGSTFTITLPVEEADLEHHPDR
jgi:signal transduction histidine kinase